MPLTGWSSPSLPRTSYRRGLFDRDQNEQPDQPDDQTRAMYQGLLGSNVGYQQAIASLPYLTARAGLVQTDYGANVGFANRDYQLSLQDLGLRRQSNILDQSSNLINRARVALGLQGNRIDRDWIQKARGFAQRDLDQALLGAMAEGVRGIRRNNSEATAGGAWFSPGRRVLNEDVMFDTRLAGERARLGYDKDIAQLDRQAAQLDLSDQDINLRLQLSDISSQQLDLVAQQLDVDRNRLGLQLQQTLHRLGMNAATDLNSILQAVASANAQIRAAGLQALQQLLQLIGLGTPTQEGD